MSKPKTCLNAITASFLVLAVLPPAFADADSNRGRGPITWITNKITGGQLFVDIPDGCAYNLENPECVLGSRIRLGSRIGGNYHTFYFEVPPGGSGPEYQIKWTGLRGTKCLDVANDGRANGAAVILWGCHGGRNQLWRPEIFYKGPHKGLRILTSVSSGRCLDVENPAAPNWPRPDAPIQIWDCFPPQKKAGNVVNQAWEYQAT